MNVITSKNNELIKQIKSLSVRKYRDKLGMFFVEGDKFIRDISSSGIRARYLISTDEDMLEGIESDEYILTDEKTFSHISEQTSPTGTMAVYDIPSCKIDDLAKLDKLVCFDRIQLPDNAGSMVRTACCAGFEGILLMKGSCDIYSPKAVRASAGMIFKMKVISIEEKDLKYLKEKGFTLYAAQADGNEKKSDFEEKSILVIGNEGNGIDDTVKALTDEFLRIPIKEGCESLNASVAAALLMYKIMGY